MYVLRICWQARGGYTRLYLCWHCHGHESHESQTSPSPTKGCRQPGQETVKNSVISFSHSKVVLPAVPTLHFHIIFTQFSQCFSRFVPTIFSQFAFSCAHVSHVLKLFFSHMFSHFRFCTFFLSCFSELCCQRILHSVQPLHCITVPETGHTSTCRSCRRPLTQFSHKAVI